MVIIPTCFHFKNVNLRFWVIQLLGPGILRGGLTLMVCIWCWTSNWLASPTISLTPSPPTNTCTGQTVGQSWVALLTSLFLQRKTHLGHRSWPVGVMNPLLLGFLVGVIPGSFPRLGFFQILKCFTFPIISFLSPSPLSPNLVLHVPVPIQLYSTHEISSICPSQEIHVSPSWTLLVS